MLIIVIIGAKKKKIFPTKHNNKNSYRLSQYHNLPSMEISLHCSPRERQNLDYIDLVPVTSVEPCLRTVGLQESALVHYRLTDESNSIHCSAFTSIGMHTPIDRKRNVEILYSLLTQKCKLIKYVYSFLILQ